MNTTTTTQAPALKSTRVYDLIYGELHNCGAESENVTRYVEALVATHLTLKQAELISNLLFSAIHAVKESAK